MNKLNLSKVAIDLLKQRYSHKGESPESIFKRVSKALAIRDDKFEKELYDLMIGGIFLPNSPCIRNAGKKKACLSACFVLPISDSIDGIFETLRNMALIFQRGGGTGTNFSSLRPKGASLTSGGTSSGVISFLQIFDATINTIKQGGFRKGASLATLDFDHPEITDFCRAKLTRQLTNFNLSVMVTDQFMKMATSKKNGNVELKHAGKVYSTIPARDILDLIALGAWVSGDPGLLFFDRINKDNKYYPQQVIRATNPCIAKGTLIGTADGRGAVPVEKLVDKDFLVYAFDGRFKVAKASAFLTKKNVGTLKIRFSDKSEIEVTSEHKFLLSDGSYSLAKDLKYGDSIQAFNRVYCNGKKYQQLLVRHSKTFSSFEPHLIGEFLFKVPAELFGGRAGEYVIHHEDRNHLNNEPSNLRLKSHSEHSSEKMFGDDNPMRKFPERNIFNNLEFQKSIREKYHIGAKRKFSTREKISIRAKARILRWCSEIETRIRRDALFVCKETWEVYKREFPSNYPTYETYKAYCVNNHKVESVSEGKVTDVYDLQVSGFNNFVVVTDIFEKGNRSGRCNKYWSGVVVHNCGEVPSLEYGACVLGSINLSKFVEGNSFNFERFYDVAKLATRALLNINIINAYPIFQVTKVMQDLNSVGVGLMGFADTLILLGIKYDSQECLDFIDRLCEPYIKATEEVAPDSFFKRSIAPTGSLSIIADCSAGIEPIFDISFERRLTIGTIEETRDIYKSEFCRTAHQVSPEWHLKIQGEFAKFIDAGVSKTINAPYNIGVEQIKKIFVDAWKMGVKGITVFREGSIEGAWVSTRDTSCEGDTCYL